MLLSLFEKGWGLFRAQAIWVRQDLFTCTCTHMPHCQWFLGSIPTLASLSVCTGWDKQTFSIFDSCLCAYSILKSAWRKRRKLQASIDAPQSSFNDFPASLISLIQTCAAVTLITILTALQDIKTYKPQLPQHLDIQSLLNLCFMSSIEMIAY